MWRETWTRVAFCRSGVRVQRDEAPATSYQLVAPSKWGCQGVERASADNPRWEV